MAVPRPSLAAAVATLAGADPVLAELIERHGPPPARRRVPADRRFADLARNIVYQQLAGRAAASIHGRFVEALDGDVCADPGPGHPGAGPASCGLSGSKAASIRDLADKVVSGEVALERIGRLSDERGGRAT